MAKFSVELPISKKPTDLELKKLKEYFKEMPVVKFLLVLNLQKVDGMLKMQEL